ncbi:uncharacterized protein [Montipora foliosa]|uniref:uncharacterized protein n=1 Tax=Montipora foliosa TaxID=591990 RepID=UPI0035F170E8
MEWTELHDLNLCEEVLVVEPWKHPYRSKERGDSWNEIANNLNASEHPTFKVSKRSVRDRLTLLQQKYKAKMRMEEAASGIDCQETKLDKALQDDNKKTEKAAAEEHRNRAVERLGETKKRSAERQDEKAQTAKKGRRSTSEVVQFLKEKSERESVLRKEDLELRQKESKGGYDENASTTTAAADSDYALFACKKPT